MFAVFIAKAGGALSVEFVGFWIGMLKRRAALAALALGEETGRVFTGVVFRVGVEPKAAVTTASCLDSFVQMVGLSVAAANLPRVGESGRHCPTRNFSASASILSRMRCSSVCDSQGKLLHG